MTRPKVLNLMWRHMHSVGRGGVVCRDRYPTLYNGYTWHAKIMVTGFRDLTAVGAILDRAAHRRTP